MVHKTSSKFPLKDVQVAHAHPYILPDAPPSLPVYPFELRPEDDAPAPWQLSSVILPSNTTNFENEYYIGSAPLLFPGPYRSSTPPIGSPALFPHAEHTEYSYRRSGETLALGMNEVFTHVMNKSKGISSHLLISPGEDGLPEDMQDILRQLDDLATWVKAASSSRHCISNSNSIVYSSPTSGHQRTDTGGSIAYLNDSLFPSKKGKNRLLSTTPTVILRDLVESPRGTVPGNPTKISLATDVQSEGFIYMPSCNTPEFLVGSSSSPVAYPVCGYSSHPPRYSLRQSDQTHDVGYRRRFLERRSAPCPPSTSPLISPPLGKISFKTLFQRSRCNTTAVSRSSIPSGHVPVESAFRQGKRMRLPWLRI